MAKPYNTSSNIGKDAVLRFPKRIKRGKGSTYNSGCYINARFGVTIGENTLIGPHVLIQSVEHTIKNIDIEQNANDHNSWCASDPSKRVHGTPIVIGSDVWIGAGVIILSGSIIPDKCVIGAGTTITESNSKWLNKGDIVVNDVKLRKLGNREEYG